MIEKDNYYMGLALREARKAYKLEEIPVGCVIVYKNTVIATGFNLREKSRNPLSHAELIAIDRASLLMGKWRLAETVIYVTLEPCPMCAGAIVQARIERLVFGAEDPKSGAAGSLLNIPEDKRFNHQVMVTGGVLREECSNILKDFFKNLRKK